jgi:hypothetical protein
LDAASGGSSNTRHGCGNATRPGTIDQRVGMEAGGATASINVTVVCGGGNWLPTSAASKGVRCRLQTLPTAQSRSAGAMA